MLTNINPQRSDTTLHYTTLHFTTPFEAGILHLNFSTPCR